MAFCLGDLHEALGRYTKAAAGCACFFCLTVLLIAANSASLTVGPSMEPAAAAQGTQLRNRAGLPAEYASIDIPGGEQEKLYYSASPSPSQEANISNDSHASPVFIREEAYEEFEANIRLTKKKMHRYPAILKGVHESYTVPRAVAVGPYHRHRDHLKEAESLKHVAAICCIRESGLPPQQLYCEVASAAEQVRHLYDKDVMKGIAPDDYRDMMFRDACFLVQYMLTEGEKSGKDDKLKGFLDLNDANIFHDVMLLENQLPWQVVEKVLSFMPAPESSSIPKDFVEGTRYCMLPVYFDRDQRKAEMHLDWDESYRPPHLLGLLRYYMVGTSSGTTDLIPKIKNLLFSMNAIKLEKIGIKLTANKTMKLGDMCLDQGRTGLSPELSLAPLSLNRDSASYLVNMAALELCNVKNILELLEEDNTAVCSYLCLLGMLVCREEDVHQLREKDLLQGGRGLTDKDVLHFFTSLQGMRAGPCYLRIMAQIGNYMEKRWLQVWFWEFDYKYRKIILSAIGIIGTAFGVIRAIMATIKA